jgi:metal-responsive CopG/Arc/MetJ family transcriptional regulator
MPNITLEGIAEVMREELKPINGRLGKVESRLGTIETIQNNHTTTLQQLLAKKKNKEEDKLIATERFDRLENWARQVGIKLGIKLEL